MHELWKSRRQKGPKIAHRHIKTILWLKKTQDYYSTEPELRRRYMRGRE